MEPTTGELTADEILVDGADRSVWPRRLVWSLLLIWLSPAILAVLVVGGLGVGVGATARWLGRLASRRSVDRNAAITGRIGGEPIGQAPRAPHLSSLIAGGRSARRR